MSHPINALASPAPIPGNGWTPERKVQFLDRLAVHGNARAACRAVGLSAEAAYKLRRRDPLFARAWAAAVVLGRDNSVEVLSERAIEGVEEEIYYRGELIGTRRRYDSRLLLAHLARLDRLADEETAGADAGRFDDLIACIADGQSDALLPPRDAYIEQAATCAQSDKDAEQRAEFPDLFDESLGYLSEEEEDQRSALDTICLDAVTRAAEEAGARWDRHLGETFAFVDALCDAPHAPVAPDLPSGPSGAMAVQHVQAAMSDHAKEGALSFPCTQSTASTLALARTLAEPPPGWATTPRSPFFAPRTMGAGGS